MSYPNAYCVKCGTHTDTQKKHTVVLQNNARALKGICPACESEVYKILAKGKQYQNPLPLTAEAKSLYPDAYCMRCKDHTPTVGAHTVMLENFSRAVTGSCQRCGSEVYRILSPKEQASLAAAMPEIKAAPAAKTPEARIPITRRAEEPSIPGQWSYLIAAGVILGTIAAFLIYALN